jgi:hypothetical protein
MKPNDPNPSTLELIAQDEEAFSEIVSLIAASRQRALQAVNSTLIDLYWQVGETISGKIEAAEWRRWSGSAASCIHRQDAARDSRLHSR